MASATTEITADGAWRLRCCSLGWELWGMTVLGIPTEIKADEYRVAVTPAGVRELVDRGHEVVVQAGAGEGSAIVDAAYVEQGARVVPDAESVFGEAEL